MDQKEISKTKKQTFCLFVVFILLAYWPFILPPIWEGMQSGFLLRPLPSGATNGEWSVRAVAEEHPSVFNTIEDVEERALIVASGKVINKTNERISLGFSHTNHLYTIYQFEVSKVYIAL